MNKTPEQIKEDFINSDIPVAEHHTQLADAEGGKEALSKDDFMLMREEQQIPMRSAILARSRKTFDVDIKNIDGNDLKIEIRVMLTKAETTDQSKFFNMMKHLQDVEDEYYYYLAGDFLALITTDPDLDVVFWRRNDIDPYIIQELIKAYIINYE